MIVLDQVREIVQQQTGVPLETLTEKTLLADDLSFDSIDIVELTMLVESEYNIDIKDEVAEQWASLGDVADTIRAEHPELGKKEE